MRAHYEKTNPHRRDSREPRCDVRNGRTDGPVDAGARRVLIVAAPDRDSSQLKAQEKTIDTWRSGAQDRDVTAVEIVGDTVDGAADSAATLRQRYNLPAQGFSVVLIGKDGHVAMRSTTPVKSASLVEKIDAMPMRREGQR